METRPCRVLIVLKHWIINMSIVTNQVHVNLLHSIITSNKINVNLCKIILIRRIHWSVCNTNTTESLVSKRDYEHRSDQRVRSSELWSKAPRVLISCGVVCSCVVNQLLFSKQKSTLCVNQLWCWTHCYQKLASVAAFQDAMLSN